MVFLSNENIIIKKNLGIQNCENKFNKTDQNSHRKFKKWQKDRNKVRNAMKTENFA